jgi:hypothetical protein
MPQYQVTMTLEKADPLISMGQLTQIVTGVSCGVRRRLAGALAPDLCGGLDEGAQLVLFVLG